MQSTDLDRLERRARRGFEQARIRPALLGVLPMALLIALVFCLGLHPHPHVMLVLGVTAIALGAALLWFGREPARAVPPATLAPALRSPLGPSVHRRRMHVDVPARLRGRWRVGRLGRELVWRTSRANSLVLGVRLWHDATDWRGWRDMRRLSRCSGSRRRLRAGPSRWLCLRAAASVRANATGTPLKHRQARL